jgi:hypothetical protein
MYVIIKPIGMSRSIVELVCKKFGIGLENMRRVSSLGDHVASVLWPNHYVGDVPKDEVLIVWVNLSSNISDEDIANTRNIAQEIRDESGLAWHHNCIHSCRSRQEYDNSIDTLQQVFRNGTVVSREYVDKMPLKISPPKDTTKWKCIYGKYCKKQPKCKFAHCIEEYRPVECKMKECTRHDCLYHHKYIETLEENWNRQLS